MYCDECDVIIPYETDTCPLCFKKISDNKILNNPMYPRRNTSFRFPAKYSFTLFYSIIALALFLIVLIVNLITDKELLWALIIGAGLIYFYVLIRHTIMTSYGSASKIFVQGFLLCFVILIIQNITHSGKWAYEYVIPITLLANTIVLWALTLIRRIRRPTYAFTLILVSILNLIPVYWYFIGYSKVLWTMIVSLSVAGITILLVLLIFTKPLISEIKRLLHI